MAGLFWVTLYIPGERTLNNALFYYACTSLTIFPVRQALKAQQMGSTAAGRTWQLFTQWRTRKNLQKMRIAHRQVILRQRQRIREGFEDLPYAFEDIEEESILHSHRTLLEHPSSRKSQRQHKGTDWGSESAELRQLFMCRRIIMRSSF